MDEIYSEREISVKFRSSKRTFVNLINSGALNDKGRRRHRRIPSAIINHLMKYIVTHTQQVLQNGINSSSMTVSHLL